jgi:hypothetical protein
MHLEKLVYTDEPVPASVVATAAPAAAIAPEPSPAPLAVSAGTVVLARWGDLCGKRQYKRERPTMGSPSTRASEDPAARAS